MAYENNERKMDSVYSQRLRAGKRRTYFFDVRETRGNDYYLTITESRKKFNEDGYDRHKIFLYKEDFNKFLKGLTEAIDFVKTDLMPDFDFDAFSHENDNYEGGTRPNAEGNTEDQSNADAPTGIAAAATPEIEQKPEEPKQPEQPQDGGNNHDNLSNEVVDKW
ncbi:MAG: DUF3276 family protein [Bacteroidetes bacterium]|nr:DUF3276 family protein [Bacteroidota bacterium]